MGVKQTPNKSHNTMLTLKKKILPLQLLGFEPATFQSLVLRSTNKLSRLPSGVTKRSNSLPHLLLNVGLLGGHTQDLEVEAELFQHFCLPGIQHLAVQR